MTTVKFSFWKMLRLSRRISLTTIRSGWESQQRAVTYLTYWHDLSVAQVAETLGVRDGTVRRQLARARSRLRGALS